MNDEVRVKKGFLIFTKTGKSYSGLTDIWDVSNSTNSVMLGEIKWETGWRRYVFFPNDGSFFDEGCLRDIADFVEALNVAHKKASIGKKGKLSFPLIAFLVVLLIVVLVFGAIAFGIYYFF